MPPRVLLVEDDVDQREPLAELLRGAGYEAIEAASAEAALAILQQRGCDLLVTDYQLGGATGAWLARVASRSATGGPPPTLLITGHRSVADADGLTVLRKPLDPATFLDEVAQALSGPPPSPAPEPSQRIAVVLYVNGSLTSQQAQRALDRVLDDYHRDHIAVTVVDVRRQAAHQAEEHRIVVTPTLVRTFPAPMVWVAGRLEPDTIVRRLFDEAGATLRRSASANVTGTAD